MISMLAVAPSGKSVVTFCQGNTMLRRCDQEGLRTVRVRGEELAAQLADLAEEHGAWLHVDGAYGLPAASLPECLPMDAGADTVTALEELHSELTHLFDYQELSSDELAKVVTHRWPLEKIAEAFAEFKNADRRFQFKGEENGITINFAPTQDFNSLIVTRVQGNQLPDIANLQPVSKLDRLIIGLMSKRQRHHPGARNGCEQPWGDGHESDHQERASPRP